MPRMRRNILMVGGAAAVFLNASPSNARDAKDDDDSSSLSVEEIVITAQRRTQNLQDVPISVSALSATQLEQAGVQQPSDLRTIVPSLELTDDNGILTTSLRGIGAVAVSSGFESPLAVYVDGVYLGSAAASFLNLANVSQIEIAKGPQGTLYGRNATAGSMQINTRTPDQNFKGDGSVSYDNYDTVTGSAYVAGGITPKLAADVAIWATHQGDGWGDNLTTGTENYVVHHNFVVRSKWVLEASERTHLTLIADYGKFSNTETPAILPGSVPALAPMLGRQPDLDYDTRADTNHKTAGWQSGVSLKLDQDLGVADLTSLTAYRYSRYHNQFDIDGFQLPLASAYYDQPNIQLSQDLQLTSKTDAKLSWIVGASYFHAKTSESPGTADLKFIGLFHEFSNSQRTDAFSGFAEGTYEIVKGTRLTLGARYTSERREAYDGVTADTVGGFPLPRTLVPDMSKTFDKPTFRATLDQRISDDVLAYASFNRGFKSGGFNTDAPGTPAFRPEQVDAYEIGLKNELLNRRLRVNIAGFYYDYTDIQVRQTPTLAVTILTNAGAARVYGADLDFEAQITPQFRVSGGVGYVDAEYQRFPDAQIITLDGATAIGDAAGNTLPRAPKLTGNLLASYSANLSAGGSLTFSTNAYYNDGYYLLSDNIIRQPSFVQLNGAVRWTRASERFYAELYARNLTDKKVIDWVLPLGATVGVGYGAPRTFGVTFGYSL